MTHQGGLRASALASALVILAACQPSGNAAAAERAVTAPPAEVTATETGKHAVAIFAGGCFWGVEGVFSHVPGVTSAVSGYHGGAAKTATYAQVSQDGTGHAEAVRVIYDPAKVRYDELLRVFFSVIADPTQRDRQGPDVGTQYRSALVPVSAEQRKVALAYLAQLRRSGLWKAPIVTRVEPLRRFYPAEAEHQDFMAENPRHPYIVRWDAPKVAALARLYPALYKRGFTRR